MHEARLQQLEELRKIIDQFVTWGAKACEVPESRIKVFRYLLETKITQAVKCFFELYEEHARGE